MKSTKILIALGATVISGVIFYVYKRLRNNKNEILPENGWQYVGTLEEILMFPIKSCHGIALDYAVCEESGLQFGGIKDRQFLVVDDNDKILFAGARPKMWKIKSKVIGNDLIEVTAPGMEPLVLNIQKLTDGRKEVIKRLGSSYRPVFQCEEKYGKWFSRFLLNKETGLRLFLCQNSKIPFRKSLNLNPYMTLVDGSIRDLNARLTNKGHHWQFRGNFLINNTQVPAFSEDNWKWMRIGNDATFRYKAPCYRCILINVNPFTCERSPDFEPLRTLKKYRMKPGQVEPEMGIYFYLHKEGAIKLGDNVFVIK